jgi:hypothetical protein
MRTLLLVLALAVGLLGLSPAVPATHCLSHDHGSAHAHSAAVATGAGLAASIAPHDHHDAAATARQAPGDDHHDGTRPATEGCCHAAPTLIGGAEIESAPSAPASAARPAPRDVQGDGRPSFDIFRPPATA